MTAIDSQDNSQSALAEVPFWLQATLDDIETLDFEAPIIHSSAADCRELSAAFREATTLHKKLGDEAAAPAARVFAMLSAVTDFHFKPDDRDSPFGPMMVMEGRRSPIPEDFRGHPVLTLANAAERARHPVLKARLSDVCWLLDRKRHALGIAAVASYVAIVEGLDSGQLKDRFERDDPILGLTARDLLRRALTVGRAVGWDSEEVTAARDLIPQIRKRAIKQSNPVQVHWFFNIDLDFAISLPSIVSGEIEEFLTGIDQAAVSHTHIELWRLAARGYHYAKDDEGEHRCRIEAAEALVSEAERQGSAMLASHWLSSAIAEYHGIPGKRKRRTELRHKLIDFQSGISEEMSSFSHPMDLREIVNLVEQQLADAPDLIDLLLIFADLESSPSPESLVADAIRSINEHPLSSLVSTSFHDSEGKVIHKSAGGGLHDGEDDNAIRRQIAQHEQIRRQIHSFGQVEVARRRILDRFYIGEDTFDVLLQYSPFVPHDLIRTFSRGFLRFFQGDFISALYILTPMLENSLRHILKMNGHDVTNFDDHNQTQEDRTISALFEQMRPELDETFGTAISTDIENVFLSKPGPHIRHALSHGLLNDGSPYSGDAIYACWLIFRLCCIPLSAHHADIQLPS